VKLLQDQSLADEIGQRAAARVRSEFGWESVSDSFVAICDRAIGHKKAQKAQKGQEGNEGQARRERHVEEDPAGEGQTVLH
jgi:hypothetical protein